MNSATYIKYQLLKASSEKICKKYQQLSTLEINEKKDTDEYNQIINEIKEIIENEKILYQSITIEEAKQIIKETKNTDDINDINSLLTTKNAHLTRITQHLIKIIAKDIVKDALKSEAGIDNILINESAEITIKIKENIDSDIILAFLFFIQETINNNSWSPIKNELIQIKYILILTRPVIQTTAITRNFNFDELFIASKLFFEVMGLNQQSQIDAIEAYGEKYLDLTIKNAITIKNEELINKSNILLLNIYQSYIKALLFFNNNDLIEQTKKHISNENTIASSAILEVLNAHQKNREKAKTLSFINPEKRN